MRYHDYFLDSYTISENGRKVTFHLTWNYPGEKNPDSHIEFSDVVCCRFSHTKGAIITEIDNISVPEFIKNEEKFLTTKAKEDGLRLWNDNISDYGRQLETGGYRVWIIESAIGFSGLIVAKTVCEL